MTDELPRIVFLDDSEDLRELMPMILEDTFGVQCMCFGNVKEFENHLKEVLVARVAILDMNLGPDVPGGIDAFNWLRDRGFRGKVLFFTGHARANPQVSLAVEHGVQILEKPLDPEKLITLVARALHETA